MNRSFGSRALMLGVTLAVGACSSPNPELYTIAPVDGAVRHGTPNVVVLQQVATPRYLERSQIVRSSVNYQIEVLPNDWWGEPLAAMIGRVLAEELGQRLPQATVFVETGAVSAAPEATIALNVQRLDEDAAGNVVLEAQAAVTIRGRAQPVLRSFRFTVHAPATDTKGEVTAISAAVGQLADALAATLIAL